MANDLQSANGWRNYVTSEENPRADDVTRVETGPGWEMRLGDYREVLADVVPDAVITDPPYGARTHKGNDTTLDTRFGRTSLCYDAWTPADVAHLVERFGGVHGWIVSMTSDDLTQVYREEYERAKRQDFAPVPILQHRPRLQGDGPGSGTVYAMVSRPRKKAFMSWGSLPCWYEPTREISEHIGGKPVHLMRAIVRDYSREGDLVCDPCAGAGTTLLAAVIEGRRAIGAEVDPETFDKAVSRLRKGYTPTFDWGT